MLEKQLSIIYYLKFILNIKSKGLNFKLISIVNLTRQENSFMEFNVYL